MSTEKSRRLTKGQRVAVREAVSLWLGLRDLTDRAVDESDWAKLEDELRRIGTSRER